MLLPDEEDKFRNKVGWRGEYELFRSAQAQHSVKHEKLEIGCEVCQMLVRNINRLAAEGEQLANHIKEVGGAKRNR